MLETVIEKLLRAFAGLLNGIPVPDWAQNINVVMPDEIGWGLSIIQADFGVQVVMSAYGIRFLIRRIPFIG